MAPRTPGGGKIIKKGMKNLQGDDAAYPKRRWQGQLIAARSSEHTHEPMRTMLKPGSVLANRFPRTLSLQLKEGARWMTHHVKAKGPTNGTLCR